MIVVSNWLRVAGFIAGCLLFTVCCKAQDSTITNFETQITAADDTPVVSAIDTFFSKYNISIRSSDYPELYYEIYRWYRTCYRYGGNSKKGIDCSHFVNMLYEKIYGKKLNSSSGSIYAQCKPVKGGMDEAQEGDLVFFKIKKKRISHIAIYLQNGLFAHATTQAGVIISSITEPYYKRHFYKVGRLE